jgi:hypothetical protein
VSGLHTVGLDAQDQWSVTQDVRPFVMRTNVPLTQARAYLPELQQLQSDLVSELGIAPAAEPIELYLFREKVGYKQYLARRFPDVPFRRALYVKLQGPGAVYTYQSRDFLVDLRHETTHALLHAVLDHVPLWIDEGLAEYYEVPAAQRASEHPSLDGSRWQAKLRILPRLEKLERLEDLSDMGRGEYRGCWAWVHFMMHGPPEARAELLAYLQDLRTSDEPELLSSRLRRRLENPDKRIATHFKEWAP